MNSLIALEELIKQEEELIKFGQKQIFAHESGENKLSRLALASAETKLEENKRKLEQHKSMLSELQEQDLAQIEENDRIKAQIERSKYFENQNTRIQNNRQEPDDLKLEAMMILDELPSEIQFEDEKIFDLAIKSLELNLKNLKEINEKLLEIKVDFIQRVKKIEDDKIKELQIFDVLIPITVLHFSILLEVFKENFQEKDDKNNSKFPGFPKYEDWWINELWLSHQSYFALYKWKDIINNFCKTGEQKRTWEKTFNKWAFIKKILRDKGELGFEYQYAFDSLLSKYAQIEEELDYKNLESMERIIKRITKAEDFTKTNKNHNIISEYTKYKKRK